MKAVWIKKEDNSEPKNPCTKFSLVNKETGRPSWNDRFFPNFFNFKTYPEMGIVEPVISLATFVTPYKSYETAKKNERDEGEFLPKEGNIRTIVVYNSPGYYASNGDFIPNSGFEPGKTFVEWIMQFDKNGRFPSRRDHDTRQRMTIFNAAGGLTSFQWLLPERDNLYLGATVNVLDDMDVESMSFQGTKNEEAERQQMCEWFAGNIPGAKFPNAKAFDFSYVSFDAFQPIEGKVNQYALIL